MAIVDQNEKDDKLITCFYLFGAQLEGCIIQFLFLSNYSESSW